MSRYRSYGELDDPFVVEGDTFFTRMNARLRPSQLQAGEALKNADALVEAEEKIEALSHGDVSALVAQGMAEHQSGFDQFTSTIKRWLTWAAIGLGCYLAIPIFVARKCSKTEALKNQTRPPFPIK